jgi:hypothetical protein
MSLENEICMAGEPETGVLEVGKHGFRAGGWGIGLRGRVRFTWGVMLCRLRDIGLLCNHGTRQMGAERYAKRACEEIVVESGELTFSFHLAEFTISVALGQLTSTVGGSN